MTKIEAVIFDVDGTIVNTTEWVIGAHKHTLAAHGFPSRTREEIASHIGKRLEECYGALAPGSDYELLRETHRDFQVNNFSLIARYEAAAEVLDDVRQAGKRIALYSSRSRLGPSLEHVGLSESMFDVVVDGTMVEQGKPHPEGVHLILEKLELGPQQAVMVGDAAVDILAAKRADLACTVGVTHGFGTREALETAEADHIIDSLLELPELIERIEQH